MSSEGTPSNRRRHNRANRNRGRRREGRGRRRRTDNPCTRPDLCGAEAACVPRGSGYTCVCPNDLTPPTADLRCIYAPPTDPPTSAGSPDATSTTGAPAIVRVTTAAGLQYLARCENPVELCGMEAACQRVEGQTTHRCICPHDLSEPVGDSPANFKCHRNIVEDDSSPPPYLLSTNNAASDTQDVTAVSGVPSWVLVFVPCLLAFLVLLAALTPFCRRLSKRKSSKHRSGSIASRLNDSKLNMPVTISENILLDERIQSNPNYYHESPTHSPLITMKLVNILKDQIINMSEIGQGCFGKVYRGVYLPPDGSQPVDVAVKLLKETANIELQEDFIREVEIMASCKHDNIVSLLGILVQENGLTPWMVFEYMAYGDLAELLRTHAPKWGSPDGSALHMGVLQSFARQVASGMEYLSSQHFVHRDLACRNILVGENMVVKISDFGMSRDIYTCDYYKVAGGSRMLPVRWMAPESISYGKFTLESDVWSYGVVLWEIFAYGKQPYYGHSNKEVVNLILRNILLIPPETCPAPVCDVMEGCWKTSPSDRINFSEVVKRLDKMSDDLKGHRYANMSSVTYSELEYDLDQLARIEEEVRALQLDGDLYLQPTSPTAHDYIQPIP